MPFLSAIFKLIKLFFISVWQRLSSILGFFFGSIHYQPPAWVRWIIAKLASNVSNLRAKVNAKPLKSLGIFVVLVALGVDAWHGYKLYEARPKPQRVKIALTVPTRTVIEENLPPNPLVLVLITLLRPLRWLVKM